jgi:L-gulonolactone oxidase
VIIDGLGNEHFANETVNEGKTINNKKDLFNAGRCGIGALGVMKHITIQFEESFNLEKIIRPIVKETLLSNIKVLNNEHEHFRFWWVPKTDFYKIIVLNRTMKKKTEKTMFSKLFSEYIYY